jgi:hypothetical protein
VITARLKRPSSCVEIVLSSPLSSPPPRTGASAYLMESLAKCGWFSPLVLKQKNGSWVVWIGNPKPRNMRAPDIVVPFARARRGIMPVVRYIRGHHMYWTLQARAAHRLATEVSE